jgi:SpoVK/Ycf46/Vps4 family AAA+-type ATPase
MSKPRDPENVELEFEWRQNTTVSFEDIGGNDDIKQSLRENLIAPLEDSDHYYDMYGIEPVRGILLHGPPGTGKTMFGRAIANKLDRPYVEADQATLTSPAVNQGPQLINRIFEEAHYLGGIVFIDEAEQLLSDRGGENSHQMDEKATNTFLSKLAQEEQDFIVILTTNRRDLIDEAVIRAGRIDIEFEVGVPDRQGRADILEKNLDDLPHNFDNDDIIKIVEETNGWSGADIESLIANAKRVAAKNKDPQLTMEHIDFSSVNRTPDMNSDFDTTI